MLSSAAILVLSRLAKTLPAAESSGAARKYGGCCRDARALKPTPSDDGAAGPRPRPGWERRRDLPGGSWWIGGAMGRLAETAEAELEWAAGRRVQSRRAEAESQTSSPGRSSPTHRCLVGVGRLVVLWADREMIISAKVRLGEKICNHFRQFGESPRRWHAGAPSTRRYLRTLCVILRCSDNVDQQIDGVVL